MTQCSWGAIFAPALKKGKQKVWLKLDEEKSSLSSSNQKKGIKWQRIFGMQTIALREANYTLSKMQNSASNNGKIMAFYARLRSVESMK